MIKIEDETPFTKCTDEQKEWAKQYDKEGTEFYEKLWDPANEYSYALSDPIWRTNHWEDYEW